MWRNKPTRCVSLEMTDERCEDQLRLPARLTPRCLRTLLSWIDCPSILTGDARQTDFACAPIGRATVLLWPNRACQESAQDSADVMLCCKRSRGLSAEQCWCSNASSAYSSKELGMVVGKLLVKARNKTGHRWDPWGTPAVNRNVRRSHPHVKDTVW